MVDPHGLPVVAKLYPNGGGEATFANMQEVWRSSFGEHRTPPGLPRPVDYLPDLGVLVMERLGGRPLVEFEAFDPEVVDEAVYLVADLHRSDAVPARRRNHRRIARSIWRKADDVTARRPRYGPLFQRVASALEAAVVDVDELVPSHGDFSPRNVLVGPKRTVLIDWDRLQSADPARDLAYFGAWCWAWRVRRQDRSDWSILDRVVALYGSLRPRARIEQRLRFHLAAGLMRIAYELVALWPEDESFVPVLAEEALRSLT
jgi:aminoglycoside phosphotransferase (APT) family kinase protein